MQLKKYRLLHHCKSCKNYHGKHNIICGFHPYGPDSLCSDYQKVSLSSRINGSKHVLVLLLFYYVQTAGFTLAISDRFGVLESFKMILGANTIALLLVQPILKFLSFITDGQPIDAGFLRLLNLVILLNLVVTVLIILFEFIISFLA
jgi:hypothetical protein